MQEETPGKKIFDFIVGLIVFLFVAGIIWVLLQPEKHYIGTYCSPQNQCRYQTFDYECPETDSANVIIGGTYLLKPNTCKEMK